MNQEQEIRAKALELAIATLGLYPAMLDNIWNNEIKNNPDKVTSHDPFLPNILGYAKKYEEEIKKA
jgi:hypothetical protein